MRYITALVVTLTSRLKMSLAQTRLQWLSLEAKYEGLYGNRVGTLDPGVNWPP
jgi:hypothetical protein